MTTYRVSDPIPPRRPGSRGSATGRWFSGPMAIMMIAFVAALPPIARTLVSMDSLIHAHNDTIVTFILWVAPFALVVVASGGLVMMYRGRQRAM